MCRIFRRWNICFFLFVIIILLVIINLFSDKPSYFGLVQVNNKETDNKNNHIITFHKIEDNQKLEGSLDDTIIYVNENEIPLDDAWDRIKTNSTYLISIEENSFPRNIFYNTNIEAFYIDN